MNHSPRLAVAELTEATKGLDALQLLGHVVKQFGDQVALASSLGAEDQVLTDMLCKICDKPRIFTLDTGRLPEETYEVITTTREKYGIAIDILFPDRQQVEEMVNAHGPNLFYESVEARQRCCRIRKIEPLKRVLSNLQAWICGLREEQSMTRTGLQRVEWDETFGLLKISPLADWTTTQVWDYIRANDVPYNRLHDQGYPSIGCAPCTRAVAAGEDIRSGRWWWEQPEHKECGLHWKELEDKGNKEVRHHGSA
ncbi:MAG: phosphoadenylyl-sulfate reductase [Phycisphaerales bacterium]|nr:MAG: phosphoadenylyl-sulfate reductase [Phycisphaerales bacterium]